MRRVLTTAVLVIAALLLGRWIAGALESDESRIRGLIDAEVAAFNGTSVRSILGGFAADYRDETSGLDRQTLKGAIVWTFQNRRDDRRRFRLRVEVPEDRVTVAVEEDRARCTFPVQLWETKGDGETMVWELAVTATVLRTDDGWRIATSQHETVQGSPPR